MNPILVHAYTASYMYKYIHVQVDKATCLCSIYNTKHKDHKYMYINGDSLTTRVGASQLPLIHASLWSVAILQLIPRLLLEITKS